MILRGKQDLTHLNWVRARNSSGTAGSFLKAYSELGGRKVYYKLSNYDAFRGIIGHECLNEIIVDRLLTHFNIEHLSYQLIRAEIMIENVQYDTWLCASYDFKKRSEHKIALDAYYQTERLEGERPLEFCVRNGWGEYIYEMLAVDYIILNRDRHGANIEVLRDPERRQIRLAPLFDHGLSLMCRCEDIDQLRRADPLADKPVQCFVGSNSARENLKLIPKASLPRLKTLNEHDKGALLDGLDEALPSEWLDGIWNMIYRRWNAYEDFRNQG